MVVISKDSPPDKLYLRKDLFCMIKPLDLTVVSIFHWVDPQLFRLLIFDTKQNLSWGKKWEGYVSVDFSLAMNCTDNIL